MEFLSNLASQYNALIKSNPGLATIISLYGLGMLAVLRSVPVHLYHRIKRQCSTTLTFTNAATGTNPETFAGFLRWFESSRWSRYSRSISLNGAWADDQRAGEHGTVVGVGEGRHFFFYKGRPFWMTRRRLESSQSTYQINYEIDITVLGRKRQLIMDLIEEFRYRPNPKRVGIFAYGKEDWYRLADVPNRALDTVIVNREVRTKIIGQIDRFKTQREWYERRGLPYKMTYLLHGIPGTGKTSFIKALACHYHMNICVINMTSMSDETLSSALNRAPKNCIIAIEDFDSASSTAKRSGLVAMLDGANPVAPLNFSLGDPPTTVVKQPTSEKMEFPAGPTLHGILQALDGLISLDEKLIFLTTNVMKELDPAIVRPGRVDHMLELKALDTPEIHEYIDLMFPGDDYDRELTFDSMAGCELQQLYFEHSEDVNAFVTALSKPRALQLVA